MRYFSYRRISENSQPIFSIMIDCIGSFTRHVGNLYKYKCTYIPTFQNFFNIFEFFHNLHIYREEELIEVVVGRPMGQCRLDKGFWSLVCPKCDARKHIIYGRIRQYKNFISVILVIFLPDLVCLYISIYHLYSLFSLGQFNSLVNRPSQ